MDINTCLIQRRFVIPFLFLLVLSNGFLKAQDNATRDAIYTKDLDSLWTRNTYIETISKDGLWLSVKEFDYKNKERYFLLNTSTSDTLDLGSIGAHEFSANSAWFGYIRNYDSFSLLNLVSEKKEVFNTVTSFEFDRSGAYLALVEPNADSSQTLLTIDLHSMEVKRTTGVKAYYWMAEAGLLLISKAKDNLSTLNLYNLKAGLETTVDACKDCHYSSITLSLNANSLVYKKEGTNNSALVHYSMDSGKEFDLTPEELEEFIPGSVMANKDLEISDDGLSVFFYRQMANEVASEPKGVEVWESSDPWIYPRMQSYKNREQRYFLTLWDLRTQTVVPITDLNFPSVQFNPNHDHALVFDKLLYEPQYKQYEVVDLYLRNFITGETELIVSQQYSEQGFISLSPSGRYVAFFKANDWWIYDSETKETSKLSHSLDVPVEMDSVLGTTDLKPYGLPGWSEDERYVILYDQYDVWLIAPNGLTKKRITNGRAKQITYRISRDERRTDLKYLNLLNGDTGISYKLDKGFILEMTDANFNTGYSIWNDTKGLEELYFEDTIVSHVLVKGNLMVFKQGKFDTPPAIMALNLDDQRHRLLFQSNPKLLAFDLGKREFFSYRNQDGVLLKGLLFYPAHFNPNKDYPMIVKIYEKILKDDLMFNSPSDYGYIGFNLLRYLTNDYFVFVPTITYAIKDPGSSVLKAVFPAVDSIVDRYPVDKTRLGLFGHSYGGYETSFVVTQTDLFAVAVAGAGVTNLEQYYHDIGWDWRKAQIWRLENQQHRMGGSYYEDKDSYKRNSPLYFIEQLETPLLLWSGKADYNVNWTQTTSMFMAMKRLGKQGRMLLFENEGHYLIQAEHQKRLSLETFNWFETYLKKEEAD